MKALMKILMILITAVLVTPSLAQDRPKAGGGREGARKQFEEMRRKQMAQHDKNKDGKIDDEERKAIHNHWQKRGAEMRQDFVKRYDKNKDGKIDDEERADLTKDFMKRIEERVGPIDTKQFDANGDGKITDEERVAAAKKIQERFLQGRNGGQSWFSRRRLDPADFDGDGTVSDGEKKLAEAMLADRFHGVL